MNNIVGKTWRDSAALIVLSKKIGGPHNTNRTGVNYDILLQTRTNRGTYQNTAVFPGGVTEPADASDDWKEVFQSFGFTRHKFNSFHKTGAHVPLILQSDPVQRHVALRITAIRETFEELGILICSREHCDHKTDPFSTFITDINLQYWRDKVSEDPKELLNLCKEHKCYPDIWRLHYWSNWLTPVSLPKRFNTAFFVTALESKPALIKGNVEVSHVQWSDPFDTLEQSAKQEVKLPPPQAYELNRISHLKDIEEVIKFGESGKTYSNELFYPVFAPTKDGILQLLPGDDLYPSELNYIKDTLNFKDKTVAELRDNSHVLHRSEVVNSKSTFIIKNYKHNNNHIDMGEQTISFYNN